MKSVAWRTILLALLPGILMVVTSFVNAANPLWLIVPAAGLSLAVVATSLIAYRRLKEWALPALGLLTALVVLLLVSNVSRLAGNAPPAAWWRMLNTALALALFGLPALLLAGIIIQRHLRGHNLRRTGRVLAAMAGAALVFTLAEALTTSAIFWPGTLLGSLYGFAACAPFVLLGLPLARRHGVRAGLYVVGAASLPTLNLIEPDYGLWATFWGDALPALMVAGYTVVAPLWALRSGQKAGKVRGLLLPVGGALLMGVIVPPLVRGYTVSLAGLALAIQLWLTLLLAISLYDDLYGAAPEQMAQLADAPLAADVTPGGSLGSPQTAGHSGTNIQPAFEMDRGNVP